jgi:hypothetical protein
MHAYAYAMQMQCNYGAKHLRCYNWGQGTPLAREVSRSRPLSWILPIVGRIVHASCQSVFGWWSSYPWPLLCGVVLFMRCGTGMASNRTEVIVVPSVLVRSVRRACSCQSRHIEPRSISLHPTPGIVTGQRSHVFRVAKIEEGVVANTGLGVGLACSS